MAYLKLVPDTQWPGNDVDPYVRLAVVLAETSKKSSAILGFAPSVLELLLELKPDTPQDLRDKLKVPQAYGDARHVTAKMDLEPIEDLRTRIADLREQVARLKLAVRQQPRLEQSLLDMGPGAPPWRTGDNVELDGRGVIVGVIDDGCAFAHRNFLVRQPGSNPPAFTSRVLYLWDQSGAPKKKGKWVKPSDFGYGLELRQAQINEAIQPHVSSTGQIEADAVYESVDYTAVQTESHGTHVLDIAAGNSGSALEAHGVAPKADIIFVQIPKAEVGHPANSALSSYLLDGVMYVFARARAEKKSAVVNISYGGYGGPHDGSSLIERGIDELLKKEDGRAVVISAGNGLNANCHAAGTIQPNQSFKPLTWETDENDPTLNLLEIWYNGDAQLSLTLTPPNGPPLEPVIAGKAFSIQADGKKIGWVFHRTDDPGNGSNHAIVALLPASVPDGDKVAPAPAGPWKIQLANVGQSNADFHAWIERDDAGIGNEGRHLQSKFSSADSSPHCTLGSLATGELAISVGGYNTATQEVSVYSACGPTRNGQKKPDVCAPAASDAEGRGILSAAGSSGQPTRMNGTSAAAPHVAGLVALMFQATNKKPLSAAEIMEALRQGAKKGTENSGRTLEPNSRWPAENAEILAGCTGSGKVNAKEAIEYLRTHSAPRSLA